MNNAEFKTELRRAAELYDYGKYSESLEILNRLKEFRPNHRLVKRGLVACARALDASQKRQSTEAKLESQRLADAPDPVAVAKTCAVCHQGGNALKSMPRDELIAGIVRILDGETPHPSIPIGVDVEALADAMGEPAPTLP